MKRIHFDNVKVGVRYNIKTIRGWRQATVVDKSKPNKTHDYWSVKFKYDNTLIGFIGGEIASYDEYFNMEKID